MPILKIQPNIIQFSQGKTNNPDHKINLSKKADAASTKVSSFIKKNLGKILAGITILTGSILFICKFKKIGKLGKNFKEETKEIFSMRDSQYIVHDSKDLVVANTPQENIDLWRKKLENINKKPNVFNINHRKLDLLPHSYKENPERYGCIATCNFDYANYKIEKTKISKIDKYAPDIHPLMLYGKGGPEGCYAAGITKDKRRYLVFTNPTLRKDFLGRTIKDTLTLISPNDSFTQAQKDLISVLDRYTKEELSRKYDNYLTQAIIDTAHGKSAYIDGESPSCNIDSFDMNLDILLSAIHTWTQKETRPTTDILNKLEKLKPGEYVANYKNPGES